MRIKAEELSNTVQEKIANRESFLVYQIDSMKETIRELERAIEDGGLSCRVYTKGRIASAGAAIFSGITGAIGVASIVGMAAHNLATLNPDYELAKNYVDKTIAVSFQY